MDGFEMFFQNDGDFMNDVMDLSMRMLNHDLSLMRYYELFRFQSL
jgi:hypothetical protein